jgi:hypothetical protein
LSGLSESSENLLTIKFHAKNTSPLVWYRPCRLAAPQFPSNVWFDETVWQLNLPTDQHLFLPPQGFTSRFLWVRDTFFWRRRAEPAYANLSAWISSENGPDDSLSRDGNAYTFSRFGPARPIDFSAMSEPFVVLFGAGLMLAVGFVLLKVPRLRSVYTFLALSFVVAVLGLWYEAPIKLLLQPAALGLLLALVALGIDSHMKRRSKSTLVPISSPSDFVLPSASSFAEQPASAGSHRDVPTALHHAPFLQQEPVSSTDAGRSP